MSRNLHINEVFNEGSNNATENGQRPSINQRAAAAGVDEALIDIGDELGIDVSKPLHQMPRSEADKIMRRYVGSTIGRGTPRLSR